MAQSMKLSKTSSVSSRVRSDVFAPPCYATRAPAVARPATLLASVNRAALSVASHPRFVSTRVAASEAASASSSTSTKEWFALVASAEFYFNDVQNESVAEQLRERVRFFKETGKDIDFYLVPEPTWLDSKYPAEAKMVKRPCVALVSTDEMWITFMKLRLDRVLRINLGAVSQGEALAVGGKIPEFKKPEKWTAPYSPYSSGWWNVFLPPQ